MITVFATTFGPVPDTYSIIPSYPNHRISH